MTQRVQELKIIAQIYRNSPIRADLSKSTTIITELEPYMNYAISEDTWIAQEQQSCKKSLAIINGLFTEFKTSPTVFKQTIMSRIEKMQQQDDAQVLINSQKKRTDCRKSGGSKQDGPGDNDSQSAGAAAIAFLKSLDDNKEKAVEAFRKSYEWLTTTSGGLQAIEHSFRENCKHNFVPLLLRMGTCITDEKGVARVGTKILANLTQKLINMGSALSIDAKNVFKYVELAYEGEIITVQGIVQDGIIKISTMYIQPGHLR